MDVHRAFLFLDAIVMITQLSQASVSLRFKVFEVASLQGFKVILGNYSPQLNIFHLMTLRPNNLITQQVERMRNLNDYSILPPA